MKYFESWWTISWGSFLLREGIVRDMGCTIKEFKW